MSDGEVSRGRVWRCDGLVRQDRVMRWHCRASHCMAAVWYSIALISIGGVSYGQVSARKREVSGSDESKK